MNKKTPYSTGRGMSLMVLSAMSEAKTRIWVKKPVKRLSWTFKTSPLLVFSDMADTCIMQGTVVATSHGRPKTEFTAIIKAEIQES